MDFIELARLHAAKLVANASSTLGYSIEGEAPVTLSKEENHGHFSTQAAFAIAKKTGKNPAEIAQAINEQAGKNLPDDIFEKTDCLGAYVNFTLTKKFLADAVAQAMKTDYGKNDENKGRTFVIEYSQPNVGKPFHVGHIRSTILGDSIANFLSETGYTVKRLNYLGDAGAQVSKLIVAKREFSDLPPMKDERAMLAYYVRIHKEIEEKPELATKAQEVLAQIEAGEQSVLEEVKFIREKSYEAFNRNYATLGIKFDDVIGESQFIDKGREIAREALEKGIAFKDDKTDALVADLEKKAGLPNTILLRSNGTTLYFTRDLALANWKQDQYGFNESLVTTSTEQNTYFRQVIGFLKLLGRTYADHYKHMGFGLVTLLGEKMSTREGKVVLMEDVLNESVDAVRKELEGRMHDYGVKDEEEIAKIIGIGSVKFAMLRVGNSKNISFDPAKVVSFDGDTGAYLQYTCVRAKKILSKAGGSEPKPNNELDSIESRLAFLLANYPAIVKQSAKNFEPHVTCDYLLKLAAAFSEFYEKNPVLAAEENEKQRRLALVAATANTLEKGLALLGIKVPEKM